MRTLKTSCILALILGSGGCSSEPLGETGGEPIGTAGAPLATTNDLTISHVKRVPEIDYVTNAANPKVQGWPAVGQNVTWRGVIRNFSNTQRTVQYRWFVNGQQIGSTGSVSVPANGSANAELVRSWSFTRSSIKLVIDPTNAIGEDEEGNNELTVASNAISVGFYVEQSLYNYFKDHQRELTNAKSTCWENWAQRQIARMNELFEDAVYTETPNGVLDRVRIDDIHIVPDGALPLVTPTNGPTTNPNLNDKTVDMQWGFPAILTPPNNNFYADTDDVSDSNPFFYEPSLIHELGHARYLIDNYGFNVHALPNDTARDKIVHTENGKNIVGTHYLPLINCDTVYVNHQGGLMDGDASHMDLYGALALNHIAGHRALDGNMNAPANLGSFLNLLPAENRVTLTDADTGQPLAGANVKVFRFANDTGHLYGKNFSNSTPLLNLDANPSGQIFLGQNPFSDLPLSGFHDNTLIMLRVAHQGRIRYTFFEAADFNIEYWRGHTNLGVHTLPVKFEQPGANPALGMECPGYFTTTAGILTGAGDVTQGSGALVIREAIPEFNEVAPPYGYVEITSVKLTNQEVSVGNQIKLDVKLPPLPPNPFWLGTVQLLLDVPSRNVNNAFIGVANLTGLALEQYHTLTFTIPQSVKTALQGQTYTDLRIKIALNVTQGSGPHLFDNLRFLP